MKFNSKAFAAIVAVFLLAACISPTPYQAASEYRGLGYSDKQVDGDLYRVSFIGVTQTPYDTALAYTLYRAAELAQSKGATHFEVIEGVVDEAALERFINAPVKTSAIYDARQIAVLNVTTGEELTADDAAAPWTQQQMARYIAARYIYVPAMPPPPPAPPKMVSLLIRLLNAPSQKTDKCYDVQDLLSRLGPKIVRPAQ